MVSRLFYTTLLAHARAYHFLAGMVMMSEGCVCVSNHNFC